jgi:hypothetical protein
VFVQIDLNKLPYLENVGHCALCDARLAPLPPGVMDDRMFCENAHTLLEVLSPDQIDSRTN